MVDEFTQTLLGIMVAVIMLGMGASLTPRDFYLALRRPYGLMIGVISHIEAMKERIPTQLKVIKRNGVGLSALEKQYAVG